MIPRVFHRAWLGGPEPAWLRPFARSWTQHNRGWRLEVWDDERVRSLYPLRNQAIYDAADEIAGRLAGQLRADVLRYELLERFGGVWVDADQEALAPLGRVIRGLSAFAAWEEDGAWIANGVIGAEPGHPFIERLVANLPASVEAHPRSRPAMMTGPRYVTREWKADPGGLEVLPSRLFYPYSYTELDRIGEEFPDAVAVHHWHNKRRDILPRLSVAVMAHKRRKEWVPGLVEDLPGARVVWDRKNDRWDTGRRALLAYRKDATHHLVVQDDAVLSRDLIPTVEDALRYSGQHPVSLYIGRRRPNAGMVSTLVEQACYTRQSWLPMRGPLWGPAIVVPVADIPEIVGWGDAHPEIENYDLKIADYYGSRGVDCWYTVPSLVDHRDTPTNPSLVPGRTASGRVAHVFIGADRSGLEVDWSRVPGDGGGTLGETKGAQGMARQRIATTRMYKTLPDGTRFLVAVPGDPIPDGVDEPMAPVVEDKKVRAPRKAPSRRPA